MSRKYQKDVRAILGIEDAQGGLDKQRPKSQIGKVRGVAYYNGAGDVDKTTGDVVIPEGTGTSSTYLERTTEYTYERRTYTVPRVVSGDDLKLGAGQEPLQEGDAITQLADIYDCTSGDAINLNIGFGDYSAQVSKCDCVDVCVEEVPDPDYTSGVYWTSSNMLGSGNKTADTPQAVHDQHPATYNGYTKDPTYSDLVYNGFYGSHHYTAWTYFRDGDGVIRVSQKMDSTLCPGPAGTCSGEVPTICNATEEQCTEYQWDTPNCYHVEKRGDLKAGWDSVDWYREAVNCVDDPIGCSTCSWSMQNGLVLWGTEIFGQSLNEYAKNYLKKADATWPQYAPHQITRLDTPYFYFPDAGNNNRTGYRSRIRINRYQSAYIIVNTDIYQINYCVESADGVSDCSGFPQVCDQYPEACANSETDPTAEDCNPLELLQPEDCCAPDCDNREWDTPDCWQEGVNCVNQTWASQTNFTETKYHEAFYSTGYSNYSNSSRVNWNWPFTGVTPEQVFSQLPDTLTITGVSGTYNKTALFYNNPYWQASYVRPAGGTTYVYISVLSCDPEHAEYCPLGTDTFETCDTDPICCKPDGQGGEICTQPKDCNWNPDGVVEYRWNPDTGKFEANTRDPDVFTDQAPTSIHPAELNVCSSTGTPISIGTAKGGGLVITYDPATNGGVTYIVRGEDGKIMAAGSGSSRDQYLDPDDPVNWI